MTPSRSPSAGPTPTSTSRDARQVRLADFQFRTNERFLYEYDLRDSWQHHVRVERRLAVEPAGGKGVRNRY
jgi:hypothetical protein